MGFIDAFVNAHHQHRQGLENPGNFGDYMKGRIRFMTAITPAYTHAYQTACLQDACQLSWKNFRLPKPEDRYPYLPSKDKKCKKKEYQGIHDRFLRDHAFHRQMIENNRDEEVCRRWDVLEDEDHTYQMSEEE